MEERSGSAGSDETSPHTLRVIRLALLGGVLMFGAVAWFVQQGEPVFASDEEAWLLYAVLGVFVLAAGGVLWAQQAWLRREDFQKKASLCIVGWAIGEGAAFAGGIGFLLTGQVFYYGAGLALMLVAFMLIPIPEE